MNIDRPALKGRAKALVTGSKPSPIWVGLVYLLLAIVVSWLSTRIIGISLTAQEFTNYYNAILSENGIDFSVFSNLLIRFVKTAISIPEITIGCSFLPIKSPSLIKSKVGL